MKIIAVVMLVLLASEAGAATVKSKSGVRVSVAASAQKALQCVVDHVEAAGVRIKSMRGHGHGTVSGSLHPSGRALDINQVARGVTRPHVPQSISNAAADKCGVVSGARWANNDNGHWNMKVAVSRKTHRHRLARTRDLPSVTQDRHGPG